MKNWVQGSSKDLLVSGFSCRWGKQECLFPSLGSFDECSRESLGHYLVDGPPENFAYCLGVLLIRINFFKTLWGVLWFNFSYKSWQIFLSTFEWKLFRHRKITLNSLKNNWPRQKYFHWEFSLPSFPVEKSQKNF